MVQARDLGDTSLEVDSYGQGDLLESEEAKGVMFGFQEMLDMEARMVFVDLAALGSLGRYRQMIHPYHPTCEPEKLGSAIATALVLTYHGFDFVTC